MKVALTVNDFLERAELVYGDRVGIVDEPDQPAPSWGSMTYREVAAKARAQAAALDALGVGVGERVAMVSQNAARLFTSFYGVSGSGRILVPINFRLNADEIAYIVEHCGASVLLVDPELDDDLAGVTAPHRFVHRRRERRGPVRRHRRAAAVDARRGRHRHDQLHERHHGPAQGRAAHPPQPLAQRHDLRLAGRRRRPRRVPAHAADVPLQRVGHALRGHRRWAARQVVLRKVDGAEILRRVEDHGVTPADCGARGRRRGARRGAPTWDGPIPGAGRMRIVVAGAPPPTRTIERVETELGWEFIQIYGLTETTPLLTDEPRPGRVRRPLAGASGPSAWAGPARRRWACGCRSTAEGEVLARGNHVLEGYWEQPDATAEAIVDGWFHTGDGGIIDDDDYLTISDRKKDVIISGGENVSSIEVEDAVFSHPAVAEVAVIGVPDEKWGETVKALVVLAPGRRRRPRPSSSPTAASGSRTTSARPRSSSATSWPAPRPASCRSSSSGRPTGKARRSRSREPALRPGPRCVARRRLLAATGRRARGPGRAGRSPSTCPVRTPTPACRSTPTPSWPPRPPSTSRWSWWVTPSVG